MLLLFSSIDARLWFSSEVQNTYQASEPQIIGSYTGTLIEEQIHVSLTFWQNKEQLSLTLYIVVTDVFILFLFYSVVNLLLLPSPPTFAISVSSPICTPQNVSRTRKSPKDQGNLPVFLLLFFFHMHNYIHKRTNTHQAKKKKKIGVFRIPRPTLAWTPRH